MNLIIADDHATVRAGIRALLTAEPRLDTARFEEAGSLEQLSPLLRTFSADILLLDLQMRGANALDSLAAIHAQYPGLTILIHSLHQEGLTVVRSLALGARGFVNKESPETVLPEAVVAVARGEVYLDQISLQALAAGLTQLPADSLHPGDNAFGLTYREREVYTHLAEGKNTKTIAVLLQISAKTVDNHKASILNKLGLSSPVELVRHAQENQFFPGGRG